MLSGAPMLGLGIFILSRGAETLPFAGVDVILDPLKGSLGVISVGVHVFLSIF
jgi:hypothetical protein